MNRRLLIVPVVGAVAFAGSQLVAGGDTELPPEPVFPTVVGDATTGDWTEDDWAVNRFVDDPFDATLPGQSATGDLGSFGPPDEVDALTPEDETVTTTTAAVAPTAAPAPAPTTTTPPPTTTVRDLSQAPPLADDGSGVDLPSIDDLPDPIDEDLVSEPDADDR
ncbi:MAG: hypothetical protein AAGA90_14860 [Actinomycetota bacterium]